METNKQPNHIWQARKSGSLEFGVMGNEVWKIGSTFTDSQAAMEISNMLLLDLPQCQMQHLFRFQQENVVTGTQKWVSSAFLCYPS